jgi:Domain of unknown function (DUF1844)
MTEENGGFKVADRRLFTEDGELREDVAHDSAGEKKFEEVFTDLSGKEKAPPDREVPMSFQTLVLSFSTTAMLQLGILANPATGKSEKDLPGAKQTIDILEILKQKTKGNLTSEEAQLLEASLYDLKMSYLKISNKLKV